jgi:hypothetical protein
VIKTIVKNIIDAIEGLANAFEHLISLEWDEIPGDVVKTYNAIANNVADAGKELANAFEKGLQSTAKGHIEVVEVDYEDETEDKKTPKRTAGSSSTRTGKGTGKSTGKGTGKSTGNKPTFAKGSLSDLENKLSEL